MSSEADILQARHLNKRTKLGPPDVYPQAKDQKEDKLNDLSLKKACHQVSYIFYVNNRSCTSL